MRFLEYTIEYRHSEGVGIGAMVWDRYTTPGCKGRITRVQNLDGYAEHV